MNGFKPNRVAIRRAVQCEHRELAAEIRAIDRQLVRLPDEENWSMLAENLTRQLVELRARLERHFHQEETEGYLDEAVAAVPRLAETAVRVKQQHPGLLAELDELIAELNQAPPTAAAWRQGGRRFRAFAHQLLRHEAAENHVLQIGYNEDFELEP